eukprot:GFUD01091516.1.p1 GENE.GFUD01091516.1~~GFUD01091516.1.p1  ORF type:complete len:195 (-),score=45.88 GFUD01091516.1:131-715(-)
MGAHSSKEGLSQEDMAFLERNTRYDKATICDFYKGFMADCPEGKLSPTTFCQIYSKCFPTGNAKEFCDHVFRTFDTDKNGEIDFKEFLLSIDVTSSGTPEEKLNWAFSMYDVDGNGWIDLEEMTKLVGSIYKMIGTHQTQTHLAKYEAEAKERAKGIFKRMDINNDGKVTKEEFTKTCLEDENLIDLLTPPSAI